MDTVLALWAFAPMLEQLQVLSKQLQQRDLYFGAVQGLVETVCTVFECVSTNQTAAV
jgi:hypothetical protein